MGEIHFSHPKHELELKNYQKPYTCDGCKEQGFGPRYRCEHCNYDLHKACMFPCSTVYNDFFEKSSFKFFDKPQVRYIKNKDNCKTCKSYCDACAKPIKGFVYHCEKMGWDLHPCCSKLQYKINIKGVKFRLKEEVLAKCCWCEKKKLQDNSGTQGWSYVSNRKDYHLHVYCATEMVVEEWKNGAFSDDNKCLALENIELPIQRHFNRRGGRGNKYWRIVKLLFKTIAGILLGDPTIILTSLVVDLVTE